MRHRKQPTRRIPAGAVRGVAGAALAVATPLLAAVPAVADESNLSHGEAVSRLNDAGIAVSSSGNCADRQNPSCTSFEQVRPATIDGTIALAEASGCPLRATGGTEVGHEISRPESHYNGYKIDIGRSACVDDHIRAHNRAVPPPYGSEAYISPEGNVYVNEGSHWDIVFPGTGTAPNPLPPPENEPLEFVLSLVPTIGEQLGLPTGDLPLPLPQPN